MIKKCTSCQEYQNRNQKEPLLQRDRDEEPWRTIGTDFLEYGGSQWLVLVDDCSNWIEVRKLNSTNADNTIAVLKNIFARFGIPITLISDNGPPFSSWKFKNFAQEWGIEHRTSSPYYPRGNGLAEKAVSIIKNILRKEGEEGLDEGLLNYRACPLLNSEYSPGELMFGRRMRTKIPGVQIPVKPERKWRNMKEWYDRGSKGMSELGKGQEVRMRTTGRTWEPAMVMDNIAPRSYLVKTRNGEYRRNRIHLQPCDHGQSLIPARQRFSDERVFEGESHEDNVDRDNVDDAVLPNRVSTEPQSPEPMSHFESGTAPRRSSRVRRQPNCLTYYPRNNVNK